MPENPENLEIPNKDSLHYNERLLSQSDRAIGAFDALVSRNQYIDSEILLPLLTKREAETSSRLEGTRVTLEDVISDDASAPDKLPRSEKKEALGLLRAIISGSRLYYEFGISNRFILSIHKTLMESAMSRQGVPGEYRRNTVGVGDYIPPEAQHVTHLMSNLFKYIHCEENISPIIKIAITHAQFEIIHPFGDGNGRIGRLLISFLMEEYGLTSNTSFFISSFFEKKKDEYHRALHRITENGDWDGWVGFFLKSCVEYCEGIWEGVEDITGLYKNNDFINFRSQNALNIRNYIFKSPIFTVPSMIDHFKSKGVDFKDKKNLHDRLKKLPDISIIRQGKGRRETVYKCSRLIEAIKKIGD